jgi:ketosteroid isomerase-like protein
MRRIYASWGSFLLGAVFAIALITVLYRWVIAAEKRSRSADADAVIATEMARGEALTKGDTTAISRMTADEFFEISRLGTLRTKADNMTELGSGVLKLNTVKYDDLSVKVYGDVAILRGIADNTGTYNGFPFQGKIRYMRVFVKRDGRWQAVAMQHTPMQP